MLTFM